MGQTALILHILIVSLSPAQYEMAPPYLDGATVDASGNIDVSRIDGAVDIEWTLGPAVTRRFVPNEQGNGPVTIAPANGQFAPPWLSSDRTVLQVRDENTVNPSGGYNYNLHLTGGDLDPRIINRGN